LDDLDWNENDEKTAEYVGDEDEFYLAVRNSKKAKKEQKELEHGQLVENNK
jgi:hypothetical protein